MLITTKHLREHGIEKHAVPCVRFLCETYGIDFRDAVANGIEHTRLFQAAKEREDVAEFFKFYNLEVPKT
jgi:hypothetical protein